MKDLDPDTDPDRRQDTDPWVEEGLRALREQLPSDESRRATLAQLGIGDGAAVTKPASRAPAARRALRRWLLGGALLGALALLLQRWLG